ncbi:MAG: hypothetical protein ABI852_10520 [Gemmatimonadaceae bacterium]
MNGSNDNNSVVRSAGDDPALTRLLRNTYAAPADAEYWAGFEQRILAQVSDTHLLQGVYAAPTDATYWTGLEQRVMSRLRDNGPVAWWAVFSEWRSAGMVAAAAVILVAGATAVHERQVYQASREAAAAAAAFTVFDSTSEPINIAMPTPSAGDKRARLAAPERYLDLIRP